MSVESRIRVFELTIEARETTLKEAKKRLRSTIAGIENMEPSLAEDKQTLLALQKERKIGSNH